MAASWVRWTEGLQPRKYFFSFFYDRPFLHVCNLEENLLFSISILGSVFSDYVVFYGDISLILL